MDTQQKLTVATKTWLKTIETTGDGLSAAADALERDWSPASTVVFDGDNNDEYVLHFLLLAALFEGLLLFSDKLLLFFPCSLDACCILDDGMTEISTPSSWYDVSIPWRGDWNKCNSSIGVCQSENNTSSLGFPK